MTKKQEEMLPAVTEEMSTLPATLDPGYDDDGLDGFEQSDIVIPRIVLPQPMSEEGTPGMLRMSLTGDEFESLDVVFLKFNKSRVMWDKDQSPLKGADPLCKSDDNISPSPAISEPFSVTCENCPYAQWGADKKAPACQETYNFLGVTVDELFPFWLALRGMSIKPTKRFLSSIKIAATAKGRKLWQAKTTISSVKQDTPKGKAYAVKFGLIEWLEGDNAAPFTEMREMYHGEHIGKSYDAEKIAGDANGEEVPFD